VFTADEIRDIRGSQSLHAFAKQLGCSPSHLGRVERGERPPTTDLLLRIAAAKNDLAIAQRVLASFLGRAA
jgi:transcriptional regulator with XRE-family HTH domain